MFNRRELFRRVAIVGVGFMGASLGLAIKKKGLARQVVGIGHQEDFFKGSSRKWALSMRGL
jgi:prephenate dehydrogenase